MKYLVITGASRGIGLATAQRFLDASYRVINLSRQSCPLAEVVNISVDLSVADWEQPTAVALAQYVVDSDSTVLVHNAGLLEKDNIRNLSATALRRVLQVNAVAPVQLNQLLLDRMPASSAIIYVGSTLSTKAVANACSYVVSKHAQLGLMRATCQDLAGTGIHTACVCPGFTDTDMLRAHVGSDVSVLEAIAAGITQNRLIEPAEIAEAIYFRATHPVINGAAIHANLGQIEH